MKLVVGLGNPGKRYARTRHNVGFRVVELLAQRWEISAEDKLFGSLVGQGKVRHQRIAVARPQSYMNRSGHPTASLLGHFELSTDDLLVVHDEVDLPFGTVRLKHGGGHGGHNGLRDLGAHVGRDFGRVRVGVGRPPEGVDTADHVLGDFTPTEQAGLDSLLADAADAVEAVVTTSLMVAQNQVNKRAPSGSRAVEGPGSPDLNSSSTPPEAADAPPEEL